MDKQVLIDKLVDELKGIWPAHWVTAVYDVKSGLFSSWPPRREADLLVHICTDEEFELRAKELGWVSGFKWGVEYPTNGEKPDLDGDIIISWKDKFGLGSTCKAGLLNYEFGKKDEVVSFAVTDSRYKPKEPELQTKNAKDLSDVIFAVSDAISVAVDAGAMPAARELQKINRDLLAKDPAVGIGRPELQAKPKMSKEYPNDFPFIGCLVEHINWGMPIKIKFLGERFFIAEKTDASNGKDREVCGFIGDLHPIKTERDKFVETALNAADKFIAFSQALYDAGFKAPDEKNSK